MSNSVDKILDSMLKEKFPHFSLGNEIRWNFTKFLIDKDGNVIDRFESSVDPINIEPLIKKLL